MCACPAKSQEPPELPNFSKYLLKAKVALAWLLLVHPSGMSSQPMPDRCSVHAQPTAPAREESEVPLIGMHAAPGAGPQG